MEAGNPARHLVGLSFFAVILLVLTVSFLRSLSSEFPRAANDVAPLHVGKHTFKSLLYEQINVTAPTLDLVLVVSNYKEEVGWITLNFPDIPALVYTQRDKREDCGTLPLCVVPNVGYEVHNYLTYIVQFYDALPQISIFVCSEEASWHEPQLVSKVRRMRWDEVSRAGYVPFYERSHALMYLDKDSTLFESQPKHYQDIANAITRIWNLTLLDKLGPPPSVIRAPCGAQFIVHAERIRRFPKPFWEYQLRLLLEASELLKGVSTYALPRAYEHLWHVFFGAQANMTLEDMDMSKYLLPQ